MKLFWLSRQPILVQAVQPNEHQTRLRGRTLVLGQVVWLVVAFTMLMFVILCIPLAFRQLQVACIPGQICPLSDWHLSPEKVHQLHAVGLSPDFYATYLLTLLSSNFLAWFTLGVFIFWRRSDDSVALLVALFLVTFGGADLLKLAYPANTPLTTHLTWSAIYIVFIGISECLFGVLLCIFPDGRFVPRWMCILLIGYLLTYLFIVYCTFVIPAWGHIPSILANDALLVCLGAQIYRYIRVSTQLQRQQMKWVLFAFLIMSIGNSGIGYMYALAQSSSYILIVVLFVAIYVCTHVLVVPIAFWIAISRSHLWGIDLLINRAMVYGALTVCVIGTYVLVVGTCSFLLQVQNNLFVSICATGLVAALFQPLREVLQRGVNRLIYGERDNPYAVLSCLGKQIEMTQATRTILPMITETVAHALKLPYVAITFNESHTSTVVASSGTPQETLVRVPLVYQDQPIGELLLARRSPGESLTASDMCLLDDIARQTSVVAHTIRLTMDLQRSRERLVVAREEERRRLRRDLHDGLGSVLAGLSLKIRAAHNLLTPGQTKVETLLTEVGTDIEQTIGDIRRIIYDLRPPSLDELGLLEAVRVYTVRSSSHYPHDGLHIVVEAPDQFPPLPAAVEVAAYRIVQEALVNVVRHANASLCHVVLSLTSDQLSIEVRDDGIGIVQTHPIGVGLIAMHERAEELGGICKIERVTPQGTCVRASLPVPKE